MNQTTAQPHLGPLSSTEEEAASCYLPPWRALELARSRQKKIREAVASNWSCVAPEALRVLATDRTVDVRRAVAANPRSPSDVLAVLARDADPEVLDRVAANRATSPETLEVLAEAAPQLSQRYINVLTNPNCSPMLLAATLKQPWADGRSSTFSRRATWQLDVRTAIAGHPNFPDSLEWVLTEPESAVRVAAAANPSCSAEILDALASDRYHWVVLAVASNPACPPARLAYWVENGDLPVHAIGPCTFSRIVENPSTPLEAWPDDISGWPSTRKRMAGEGMYTPAAILSALARDESAGVRAAVATNPRCTIELLWLLSSDHPSVTAAVLTNPSCTSEIRAQIQEQISTLDATQLTTLIKALTSIPLPGNLQEPRVIESLHAALTSAVGRVSPLRDLGATIEAGVVRDALSRLQFMQACMQSAAKDREVQTAPADWQTFVAPYGADVERVAWGLLCDGFAGTIQTLAKVAVGAVA